MPQRSADGPRFSDQLAAVLADLARATGPGLDAASAAACAVVLGVSGVAVRVAAGTAVRGADGGGEPV